MIDNKAKWDEKHKNAKRDSKPLTILEKYISYAKKGKALDIACGMGRNALSMRDCGFFVDCVDISEVAINSLKNKENLNPILADLEDYQILKNSYEVICVSYFLERKLYSPIKEGLKKGGVLFFETFLKDENLKYNAKMNPAYLLEKNELLKEFIDFEILYYESKIIESNESLVASLVARK